jgi:hypothetical protein
MKIITRSIYSSKLGKCEEEGEEGGTTFSILRQEKGSAADWDSSWPQRNVKAMMTNNYATENRLLFPLTTYR